MMDQDYSGKPKLRSKKNEPFTRSNPPTQQNTEILNRAQEIEKQFAAAETKQTEKMVEAVEEVSKNNKPKSPNRLVEGIKNAPSKGYNHLKENLRNNYGGSGLKGGSSSGASDDFLIFLGIIVHIIKFSVGFQVQYTWLFDLSFFAILWLLLLRPEDKTNQNLRGIMAVLILSIFLPVLGNMGYFNYNSLNVFSRILNNIILNPMIWPWWFYYFVLILNHDETRIARFLKKTIIFLVIFSLISLSYSEGYLADLESKAITEEQKQAAKDFYYNFLVKNPWEVIKKITVDPVKKFWENQQRVALGEYYTGDIDKNAKEKLGVYFLNVEASKSTSYNLGEPVVVSTDVWAQTLKKPINITFSCQTESGEAGKMSDPGRKVSTYDQTIIDCVFEKGLRQGPHEITLKSNFGFDTSAYIKSYFIDREDIRPGEDKTQQLTRNRVTNLNPSAIYTAGPINIGIKTSQVPVPIDRNGDNTIIPLRFTLSNEWEGSLKKVNKLLIQIPKEFKLREEGSNTKKYCGGYLVEETNCAAVEEEGCDDDIHRVYRVISLNNIPKIGQNDYYTMGCNMEVDNANEIFGDQKIYFATKHFRIITEYDYELTTKLGISVLGGERIKMNLADCTSVCADEDGCYCPAGCKAIEVINGKACGVVGLEKGKLVSPIEGCNKINSCSNNLYNFNCEDKEENYKVVSVYDGGKVTKSENNEIEITYDGDYIVSYQGLAHISQEVGALPAKNAEVGTIDNSLNFKITKGSSGVDLTELYNSGYFDFEGESCLSSISYGVTCTDMKGCTCPPDCDVKTVTKDSACCEKPTEGELDV